MKAVEYINSFLKFISVFTLIFFLEGFYEGKSFNFNRLNIYLMRQCFGLPYNGHQYSVLYFKLNLDKLYI